MPVKLAVLEADSKVLRGHALAMQNQSTKNRPHSKWRHLYPIVRIDFPFDRDYPGNTLAVVKVFSSEPLAMAEASRLSKINADKSCTYVVCTSRLVE